MLVTLLICILAATGAAAAKPHKSPQDLEAPGEPQPALSWWELGYGLDVSLSSQRLIGAGIAVGPVQLSKVMSWKVFPIQLSAYTDLDRTVSLTIGAGSMGFLQGRVEFGYFRGTSRRGFETKLAAGPLFFPIFARYLYYASEKTHAGEIGIEVFLME